MQFFKKLEHLNNQHITKLDEMSDLYTSVEAELRQRMKEMKEVTETMNQIGQRDENIKTLQKNLDGLEDGSFCSGKKSNAGWTITKVET
jgi:predicted  nucleic acid-binding Zn-ribbon protein